LNDCAGGMQLETVQFDLRGLLQGVMNMFLFSNSEKLKNKTVEINAEVAKSVPDIVCGDKHRLRQVLINLVGSRSACSQMLLK
jgi:two-component system sensor histidine kinase/response regulator